MNYTPLTNLIRIPDDVDPKVAAIFACPGPTAMHAFQLARRAGIDFAKIKSAVVQGLGPVGCFSVMYLHAIGVESVYAVTAGNNESREALAKQLGAKEVLNLTSLGTEAVTERLQKENGGLGADLCVEASGAPDAVPQGMDILRNRGVYLVPGQYSNSGGITIQPQMITFKALHIIGSSQYSACDVEKYLEFLKQNPGLHSTIGKLGRKYPIDGVNEAFADAKMGSNIKTLLVKAMDKFIDILLFGGQSNMQGQSEALTDTRPVEHSYEYRFLSDSMVPLKNPVGEDITYNKTAGKAVTEKTDLGVWLKEHVAGSSCYGNTNLVPAFCKAYTKWTQTDALAVHTAKGSTQIADWVPGTPGYSMILEKGKAAVLKAETQYTVRHIFFVWLQGESDAIAGTPKSLYKEKIASLAAALEKDLSIEKFGIIRVGQFTNGRKG